MSEILCLQVRASHYSGYCLQVPYFSAEQWLALLNISNALLVTAVHVKMKIGDNSLNNEIQNLRIVALILLPYNISIILKLKGHIKGRVISRTLNF